MINADDRHRLHQFLMVELAIRYLTNDLDIIRTTKCTNVFVPLIETLLKKIQLQYHTEKRYFDRKKIQLIRWKRIDQYFSEVRLTTAGENAVLTYANQAVKMHVEELIIKTYQGISSNNSFQQTQNRTTS